MKKIFFTVCILFYSMNAISSHLMGGSLQINYKSGYAYTLKCIKYFDVLHASPGVIESETEVVVSIFDKENNQLIETIVLPRISYNLMSTTANCRIAELETASVIFQKDLVLSSTTYDNIEGYYMVHETCCRSEDLSNIQDPDIEGTAFYLEFPPVKKNGVAFINSTPGFPTLYDDYACIDSDFTLNFSVTDLDGDSLAYHFITPLAGHATEGSIVEELPIPYDSVIWKSGFGLSSILQGTIAINKDGLITTHPTQEGTYAYSIKIEEYRSHQRIGFTQVQFQLLVADCQNITCLPSAINAPLDNHPKISAWPNPFQDKLSISFQSDVSNYSEIELWNCMGQKVRVISFNGNEELEIQTSDLAPGLYFIKSDSGFIKNTLTKLK